MRVVLDTNIWVSSLSRRSEFNWVFQAFLDEAYTLVVSHEILLEYEEILNIKYGEASYLVSEDRDFRSLQSVEFPEVTVLRMHEFEQLLKNT